MLGWSAGIRQLDESEPHEVSDQILDLSPL
jgi:hypothetical protein